MSRLSKGRGETSLVIRRTLQAPRERVFRAWTDPAHLMRWMAPGDDFRVPEVEVDLKTGGRYRIVMVAPDGEISEVGGAYIEVVPTERLVFSWAWVSTPERVSRVTIELADDGADRTLLTLTHERFFDKAARDRHEQGWIGCLDRLGRHLATNP